MNVGILKCRGGEASHDCFRRRDCVEEEITSQFLGYELNINRWKKTFSMKEFIETNKSIKAYLRY